MGTKRLKRPRDPLQLAKLIGDIATGATADGQTDKRNPAAVELGRKGGLKGGRARANALSEAQLRESGRKAAQARWAKRKAEKD